MAAMLDGFGYFKMGFSWGGYESLALPISAAVARRTTAGWDNTTMVRLHIGLEDVDDLIDDLKQGLRRHADTLKQGESNA